MGGTPVLILLHPDGRSLRCFDRRLEGETLEMFLRPESDPPVLLDGGTGSEWDFTGLATAGPLSGKRLGRVPCLKDYWFDWKAYNPGTALFKDVQSGDSAGGPIAVERAPGPRPAPGIH